MSTREWCLIAFVAVESVTLAAMFIYLGELGWQREQQLRRHDHS